jgi:Fic family protein
MLECTYNSNGIEGNTLILQETTMVLEEYLTVSGKSLNEYFETVNHHEAIN